MIIAIDFDGTIARTKYPTILGEVDGAREAMEQLHEAGHYLIIWTCRKGEHLTDAINWLLAQGVPFDRVNASAPADIERWGDNGRKIGADIYIDDKNLGGFPGWAEVLLRVASRHAHAHSATLRGSCGDLPTD